MIALLKWIFKWQAKALLLDDAIKYRKEQHKYAMRYEEWNAKSEGGMTPQDRLLGEEKFLRHCAEQKKWSYEQFLMNKHKADAIEKVLGRWLDE